MIIVMKPEGAGSKAQHLKRKSLTAHMTYGTQNPLTLMADGSL